LKPSFRPQGVFPEQKPIDRAFIDTWEDPRVVGSVKKTGRKKVIMAALWTEICLAMPAIQVAGEGYEVYAVTDASGGVTSEAHEMTFAGRSRLPSSRGRPRRLPAPPRRDGRNQRRAPKCDNEPVHAVQPGD
jgi:Isochorismatase family